MLKDCLQLTCFFVVIVQKGEEGGEVRKGESGTEKSHKSNRTALQKKGGKSLTAWRECFLPDSKPKEPGHLTHLPFRLEALSTVQYRVPLTVHALLFLLLCVRSRPSLWHFGGFFSPTPSLFSSVFV